MLNKKQFFITVSGGSIEENAYLTRMVSSALQEKHFTDVRMSANDETRSFVSVFDLVRSFNPEFFKSPVLVASDPAELRPAGVPFNFCSTEPIEPLPYDIAF